MYLEHIVAFIKKWSDRQVTPLISLLPMGFILFWIFRFVIFEETIHARVSLHEARNNINIFSHYLSTKVANQKYFLIITDIPYYSC